MDVIRALDVKRLTVRYSAKEKGERRVARGELHERTGHAIMPGRSRAAVFACYCGVLSARFTSVAAPGREFPPKGDPSCAR